MYLRDIRGSFCVWFCFLTFFRAFGSLEDCHDAIRWISRERFNFRENGLFCFCIAFDCEGRLKCEMRNVFIHITSNNCSPFIYFPVELHKNQTVTESNHTTIVYFCVVWHGQKRKKKKKLNRNVILQTLLRLEQ